MSVKEVSVILGLHYNTILKYISLGLIHAVRIGKSYRISKEELDRIMHDGIIIPKEV
jgi:excisionase family DNA binding protein